MRAGWGHRTQAVMQTCDAIPPTPTPPKCVVGPPREGEVWSELRRLDMQACSFVAAMRFSIRGLLNLILRDGPSAPSG